MIFWSPYKDGKFMLDVVLLRVVIKHLECLIANSFLYEFLVVVVVGVYCFLILLLISFFKIMAVYENNVMYILVCFMLSKENS